jgi:hypothetical protein
MRDLRQLFERIASDKAIAWVQNTAMLVAFPKDAEEQLDAAATHRDVFQLVADQSVQAPPSQPTNQLCPPWLYDGDHPPN